MFLYRATILNNSKMKHGFCFPFLLNYGLNSFFGKHLVTVEKEICKK